MQAERVVLPPAAAALESILKDAGFSCVVCHDPDALGETFDSSVGAVMLMAEELDERTTERWCALLQRQPPWSDLPVLLLGRADDRRLSDEGLLERLGNVFVQPWPTEPIGLIGVLRAALRSRRRQCAERDRQESQPGEPAGDQVSDQPAAANAAAVNSNGPSGEARVNPSSDEILSIVQRAQEPLLESDRRKDQFLAILAHELRNPLVPIRTGLEMLAMSDTQHAEIVDLMQQQTVHLARLVDDLLDVSRIISGRIELRKEPVELRAIVDRSVAAVTPLLSAKAQQLSVAVPPEPIRLHADPVRLVQVVENLLSNASKYTDNGGHIDLSVQASGGYVELTVRDNGIGIDPELLPGLFDLFSQAAASIDRSQGGLGIGLTLVKSLVEMHGGMVEATSRGRGQGSEFTVRLPVSQVAVNEPAPPSQPPTAVPSRRILVVDDNPSAVKALSLLLTKMGSHEVSMAMNGVEALERIRHTRPDLVLLDIGLPGMNGYQVARAVRADPELKGILLAAVTGYGRQEDRQQSAAAGFDRHLVKPFSMRELAELLADPKLNRHAAAVNQTRTPSNGTPDASCSGNQHGRAADAARPSLKDLVHDLRNHSYVLKTILEVHRSRASESDRAAPSELVLKMDAEVQALGRTIETLKRMTY